MAVFGNFGVIENSFCHCCMSTSVLDCRYDDFYSVERSKRLRAVRFRDFPFLIFDSLGRAMIG